LDWFIEVRKKAKEVTHGNLKRISGKDIEELQNKAESFVLKLNELTKSIIKNEKIIKTEIKQL
ncbi:hypothetical protein J4440_06330, partial [Candidatus Woesearchaeota archaeon]|nr:hypothetical protein [Candidatus Woesearchaeota archaeon]